MAVAFRNEGDNIMKHINTLISSRERLAQYRAHSDKVYADIGLDTPEVYTCDSCTMKEACRFVYAPININGVCSAVGLALSGREAAGCDEVDVCTTLKHFDFKRVAFCTQRNGEQS